MSIRFSLLKLLAFLACLTTTPYVYSQTGLSGVAAPANPQSQAECQDLASRWYEKRKQVQMEVRSCYRRDGGTVSFQGGPWMPNCGTRQQAYLKCAALDDQLCWIDKQSSQSAQECNAQVQRNQAAKAIRDRAIEQTNSLFVNTLPTVGGSKIKEKPNRSTSQSVLEEVGDQSDKAHKNAIKNPLVSKIGREAAEKTRENLSGTLEELERGLNTKREENPVHGPKSSQLGLKALANSEMEESEQDLEDEETEEYERRAEERLRLMQEMTKSLQDVSRTLQQQQRAGPGSTYAPYPTRPQPDPYPGTTGTACRCPEVVGNLPLCRKSDPRC